MAYLANLDDDELILAAENAHNPLTTTDLESELLHRFVNLKDLADTNEPLLELLDEAGIDNPEDLQNILNQSKAFEAVREVLESLTL